MRVLIADDHALVRAGVRRLVESFHGFEVVAEAQDGREALELVARHRPELVLLDLSMPGMHGLQALSELLARWPGVAVVIMSMHGDPARVREALDRGALGYVVKEAAVGELELALRVAAGGRVFLSPQVSGPMLGRRSGPDHRHGIGALSPRQREVLRRLGRGESTKEIAAGLGISAKTVETHRARMMQTLGCRRAAELLRFALRHAEEYD